MCWNISLPPGPLKISRRCCPGTFVYKADSLALTFKVY
jgi:hypothetical protein